MADEIKVDSEINIKRTVPTVTQIGTFTPLTGPWSLPPMWPSSSLFGLIFLLFGKNKASTGTISVVKSPAGITVADTNNKATTLSQMNLEGAVKSKRFKGMTSNVQLYQNESNVILTAGGSRGLQYVVTTDKPGEPIPLECSFATGATEYAVAFDKSGNGVVAGRNGTNLHVALDTDEGTTEESVLSTNLDRVKSSQLQVATSPVDANSKAVLWAEADGTLKAADLTQGVIGYHVIELFDSPKMELKLGQPVVSTLSYDAFGKAFCHAAFMKVADPDTTETAKETDTGASTGSWGVEYRVLSKNDIFNPNAEAVRTSTISKAIPGSLQMAGAANGNLVLAWKDAHEGSLMAATSSQAEGMGEPQMVVPGLVKDFNLASNGEEAYMITYRDKGDFPGAAVKSVGDRSWKPVSGLDKTVAYQVAAHVGVTGTCAIVVRGKKKNAVYTQSPDNIIEKK